MHAGVAQRWDVDTIKIGRILKIWFHSFGFWLRRHIIIYIKERFRQKVKIVVQFVKQTYHKITVTLQRDSESHCEDAHARHNLNKT